MSNSCREPMKALVKCLRETPAGVAGKPIKECLSDPASGPQNPTNTSLPLLPFTLLHSPACLASLEA